MSLSSQGRLGSKGSARRPTVDFGSGTHGVEPDLAVELLGGVRALMTGQRQVLEMLGQIAKGEPISLQEVSPDIQFASAEACECLDQVRRSQTEGGKKTWRPEPAKSESSPSAATPGAADSSGDMRGLQHRRGSPSSISFGTDALGLDVGSATWSRHPRRSETICGAHLVEAGPIMVQSMRSSSHQFSGSFQLREELESSDVELTAAYEDNLISGTLSNRSGPQMMRADSARDLGVARTTSRCHDLWRSFMVLPTSPTRLAMDLASLVTLSYDLFSLPYLLAFDVALEGLVLYLTYASVIFWVLDVLFTFRTGVYKHGTLIMEPREVARHYIRRHFLIDITIIGMDSVALVFYHWQRAISGTPDAFKLGRVIKLTRLVRCLNVVRARSIPDILDRLTVRSTFLHATTTVLLETLKFALVILWLNHSIACGWYAIGRMRSYSDTGGTWLDQPTGDDQGGIYGDTCDGYLYTTSLHWALTQMTPGSMQVFPQNSCERIYNNCALIFGMLVFSTLISSISSTVSHFKMQMKDENSKLVTLRKFLKMQRVRPSLSMQVQKQAQEKLKWRKPLVYKDVEAIELLSLSLRSSLHTELCRPYLLPHAYFMLFFEMDPPLSEEACRSCTDIHVLARGDTLFLAGSEGSSMHVIKNGSLKYCWTDPVEDRPMSTDVHEGRWLAEASLWCLWTHAGLAEVDRTGEACEVMSVLATKFVELLRRRGGSMHPLSWVYAQSFCICLSNSRRATDLDLHFDHAEVISAMPHQAKVICGRMAIKALKRISKHQLHLLSTQDQMQLLSTQVEEGKSVLMLTGAKVKVHRIVTKVALRMHREDGKMLVCIVEIGDNESGKAACQLPETATQDGEHAERAIMRLLHEDFGSNIDNVVIEETSTQEERDEHGQHGIGIRTFQKVFLAKWSEQEEGSESEPLSPVAKVILHPRVRYTIPGGPIAAATTPPVSPTKPAPGSRASAKPAGQVEVFELNSGQLAAWVSEDQFASTGPLQWLPDRHPYLKELGLFQRQNSSASSILSSNRESREPRTNV